MLLHLNVAAKKSKTPSHPSTAPLSPDSSYRPLSPPAFAPASPTASTSALPNLDITDTAVEEEPSWEASWVEGGEEIEYEDDWEEETYAGVGAAAATVQLDFGGGGKSGHWDDADLVKGWEREKKQWEVGLNPVSRASLSLGPG